MEYGLTSKINQYADNHQIAIQQVQPSNEIAKLKNGNEAKEIAKENFLKGVEKADEASKTSETKEVSAQKVSQYQEVVLTNLNFGYNSDSRDFFVKAVRGNIENQFPTDEMMKMKAYFIAQAKAEAEAALNS